MTLKMRHQDSAEFLIAKIEAQLLDHEEQLRNVERLRERVRKYEQQFGIASADIHRAIDEGRLRETQDVCDWIIDYDSLVRIGEV